MRRAQVRSLAIDELTIGRVRVLKPRPPATVFDERHAIEKLGNPASGEPSWVNSPGG